MVQKSFDFIKLNLVPKIFLIGNFKSEMRVLELELKACGYSVAIGDRVGAREKLQLNAVLFRTPPQTLKSAMLIVVAMVIYFQNLF